MSLYEKLLNIQTELKATKDLFNKFGNYTYRSCESILEAFKPLQREQKVTLVIQDDIVLIGDRFYCKATATITDIETGEKESATAFAREEETKKGMDGSQITGAASSYARKYALNGLFCIDDNKDSDTTNTHGKENKENKNIKSKTISDAQRKRMFALSKGNENLCREIMNKYGYESSSDIKTSDYDKICREIESRQVSFEGTPFKE